MTARFTPPPSVKAMQQRWKRSQSTHTMVSKPKPETSVAKKPPLTHFISLPIGHHTELRNTWTRISKELLESHPPIQGLHDSIILKPGSLHLTLGVLSLTSPEPELLRSSCEDQLGVSQATSQTPTPLATPDTKPPADNTPPRHTVGEALRLLQTLETPITEILKGTGPLKVFLERMDVMRSRPNQKPEQSHVMWAGPNLDNPAGVQLKQICDLVHSTFKTAGMLQDDRPLKLHCTLINTVYRKEKDEGNQRGLRRKNNRRIPFSFSALLSSSAYAQIATPKSRPLLESNQGPYTIDLGSWTVNEVQLCEMGSKDVDGVYRSVGAIKL